MLEPNWIVPWRRGVMVEQESWYQLGDYGLFDGLRMRRQGLPKGDGDPAVMQARQIPKARAFLGWARFPMYNVVRENGITHVWISDARYRGASWATIEVTLP
jgi:hypothetical protein